MNNNKLQKILNELFSNHHLDFDAESIIAHQSFDDSVWDLDYRSLILSNPEVASAILKLILQHYNVYADANFVFDSNETEYAFRPVPPALAQDLYLINSTPTPFAAIAHYLISENLIDIDQLIDANQTSDPVKWFFDESTMDMLHQYFKKTITPNIIYNFDSFNYFSSFILWLHNRKRNRWYPVRLYSILHDNPVIYNALMDYYYFIYSLEISSMHLNPFYDDYRLVQLNKHIEVWKYVTGTLGVDLTNKRIALAEAIDTIQQMEFNSTEGIFFSPRLTKRLNTMSSLKDILKHSLTFLPSLSSKE